MHARDWHAYIHYSFNIRYSLTSWYVWGLQRSWATKTSAANSLSYRLILLSKEDRLIYNKKDQDNPSKSGIISGINNPTRFFTATGKEILITLFLPQEERTWNTLQFGSIHQRNHSASVQISKAEKSMNADTSKIWYNAFTLPITLETKPKASKSWKAEEMLFSTPKISEIYNQCIKLNHVLIKKRKKKLKSQYVAFTDLNIEK